jgi:hypothetical protein
MSRTFAALTNPTLADLAKRIKSCHEATTTALKSSVEHAIAAGDLLLEAKKQVNQHGAWLPWLSEHCAMPERTAQLYMRLAKSEAIEAQMRNSVADLTVRGAIELLAPPLPSNPGQSADERGGRSRSARRSRPELLPPSSPAPAPAPVPALRPTRPVTDDAEWSADARKPLAAGDDAPQALAPPQKPDDTLTNIAAAVEGLYVAVEGTAPETVIEGTDPGKLTWVVSRAGFLSAWLAGLQGGADVAIRNHSAGNGSLQNEMFLN